MVIRKKTIITVFFTLGFINVLLNILLRFYYVNYMPQIPIPELGRTFMFNFNYITVYLTKGEDLLLNILDYSYLILFLTTIFLYQYLKPPKHKS